MMLDDMCDEAETLFSGGAHVVRSRQQVEQEIQSLKSVGYSALRGGGGGNAWLMNQCFPKSSAN
jgi:hypothetical protein